MKSFKLSVIILALILSATVWAGGPPKVTDLLPQPFQIILTAEFEDQGGYESIRDTDEPPCDACSIVIDEDKTATLQYVTCRMGHSDNPTFPSDNGNFRLIVGIDGGSMSEMVILASDMEPLEKLTPSPVSYESSFDMISACIGKHCNSLGDGQYVSLTLEADRDLPGAHAETLICMISGLIY